MVVSLSLFFRSKLNARAVITVLSLRGVLNWSPTLTNRQKIREQNTREWENDVCTVQDHVAYKSGLSPWEVGGGRNLGTSYLKQRSKQLQGNDAQQSQYLST